MERLGFIPLRKGSKGIPHKNRKKFLGRPLFSWVLNEAIKSNLDKICIYTDDDWILDFVNKQYTWTDKIIVVQRPENTATDEASTESAILEFCKSTNYSFDVFCLLQVTSPFTKAEYINKAIGMVESNSFDSSISVVRDFRFHWSPEGKPLNYDIFKRPRRQDFQGNLVENGAIYATSSQALKASGNRISGKIGVVVMPFETYHEIDDENDWLICEELMRNLLSKKSTGLNITHFIIDIDGIFTDAKVGYDKDGELFKVFSFRDGMGLELLRDAGVEPIIVTSENSEIVEQRMQKLKISEFYLGVKDKFALVDHLVATKKISWSNLAYLGDDINDLAPLLNVGLSFAPIDAVGIVLNNVDIVMPIKGGEGVVRSVSEKIIQQNKKNG